MTKPIIIIQNAETGEVVEREMNDAEFAQWEKDQAEAAERAAKAAEIAAAKAALLAKLGITEEEAKLLLS